MPARKKAIKTAKIRSPRTARQTVTIRRKHTPTYFKHMAYGLADQLSAILLREINRNYGDAMFFTREDLLQLPAFGYISTISRYQTVCTLVDFLITNGDLIAKSKTNLCLKAKSGFYESTPLHEQYSETIGIVVSKFRRESFTVMDVVDVWKTDKHLTINNKRVAVRNAMRRLVRDEVINYNGDLTYSNTKAS